MNRPSFGRGVSNLVPPQQSGSTIDEIIRTAKARIASIDAQMTAYRDMTDERAALKELVSAAEAKKAPPVAVVPPPEPPPPPEPGKVTTGPSKRSA